MQTGDADSCKSATTSVGPHIKYLSSCTFMCDTRHCQLISLETLVDRWLLA